MSFNTDYSYLGIEGLNGGTPVRVTNYSPHIVSMVLSDGSVVDFQPYESEKRIDISTKMIPFHQLHDFRNLPGGEKILYNYLSVESDKVRQALNLPLRDKEETPELFYTEDDILKMMEEDDEDGILDALEFGPQYIGSWVKNNLVKISDINILEKYASIMQVDPKTIKDNYDAMHNLGKYSKINNEEGSSFKKQLEDEDNKPKEINIVGTSGRRRKR